MSKDNGVVQCPAEDCKKHFDNRERFKKHVTEQHPPSEVVEVDEGTQIY